jgi:hypothetical protein
MADLAICTAESSSRKSPMSISSAFRALVGATMPPFPVILRYFFEVRLFGERTPQDYGGIKSDGVDS